LHLGAPIFLIIAAAVGFTSGAYLDGEISPHSFSVPVKIIGLTDTPNMSIFQTGELSSTAQSIIDNAYIDFNIAQVPDGKYFRNIIDQCIFRSDESFKPLCVKCDFLNNMGKIIGSGEKIDLESSYTAKKDVIIDMTPVSPIKFIDATDVDGVRLTLCNVKTCPDDHDNCKCDERKKDHKKQYDDFDNYYKNNKNKFGKDGHSKFMKDIENYMEKEGKYMDKSDYQMFMNYHENFLKNNKNSFSSSEYKHSSGEHEKYSKDNPNHHDDDDDDCKEKSDGFFVGGGKVYVPKSNNKPSFTLTHGFELHCDATQAPNNLEINWNGNRFHLDKLVKAECIDDGTHNEPPPSPHPGPTLDVYKGEGYGLYNGKCGAYATWSMDDNGEPGKTDHILSLVIKDEDNNVVLNIGKPDYNALKLQKGNHQFVPHPSNHPHPPTQTLCPKKP